MDPIDRLLDRVGEGGDEIRLAFVSSPLPPDRGLFRDTGGGGGGGGTGGDANARANGQEPAAEGRRSARERHRHYVGDWFRYLRDKRNRATFLQAMRHPSSTRIKRATFVFRLDAAECDGLATCHAPAADRRRHALPPFEDLVRFLCVAVGFLQNLEHIRMYVHGTNTFRDVVYDFIGRVLDCTVSHPIKHFDLMYPISDSEWVERYLCQPLKDHPSLTRIRFGMTCNPLVRIVSPDDAESINRLVLWLSRLCNDEYSRSPYSGKYNLMLLHDDSGRSDDADDPELLVTDNLKTSIELENGAHTISINAMDEFVSKTVTAMFLPYFQEASSVDITIHRNGIRAAKEWMRYNSIKCIHFPTCHEGYSLLAELCNQSQVKSLKIDYIHERNANNDCFLFAGLKYRLSEISIGSHMLASSLCNDLLSYLSIYGDENLNLSLNIQEMTSQIWDQWCSDLAHEKVMNKMQLWIPKLTDLANRTEQDFVSGIKKFINAKNKIKCLHLNSFRFFDNEHPITTQEVLQCIEELRNKSPIERLEFSGIYPKLNTDQATLLCNELELNYTLCGNDFHVNEDEPEWKWLELQIWSMFWLNYCGRKNALLNSGKNTKREMMNCLLRSVDIPSKQDFLSKLYNLQNRWDPPHSDAECGFQKMFSLNCMFIHLREIPIIFDNPKSERQAKRPRIENA